MECSRDPIPKLKRNLVSYLGLPKPPGSNNEAKIQAFFLSITFYLSLCFLLVESLVDAVCDRRIEPSAGVLLTPR